MSRDYKKEREWEQRNYRRFNAKLENSEADRLQAQLDRAGVKFTQWVRAMIEPAEGPNGSRVDGEIAALLDSRLNWDDDKSQWRWANASTVLRDAGYDGEIGQSAARQAVAYIRERTGQHEPKRSKGQHLYNVPQAK